MKMLKRVFAVVCLMACLVNVQMPVAMAAELENGSMEEVMPRMTYIVRAECDLTIDDGYANIYASVSGRESDVTKCEIEIELQEKSLLRWETIHTWDKTVNGTSAESDVMKRITSGNSYRAVVTVTVWSGSASESQTMTSDVVRA